MRSSLAALLYENQSRGSKDLVEGIQSLNQGMQTWIDSIQKKRQERTHQAILGLVQQKDIPWDEVNRLLADVDIDPVAIMQSIEPVLANQKRQQLQTVGPIIANTISSYLNEEKEIPTGEIFSIASQYGMGFGETIMMLKLLQESGILPTSEQKIEREKHEFNVVKGLGELGVSLNEKGVERAKNFGINPYTEPGQGSGDQPTKGTLTGYQKPQTFVAAPKTKVPSSATEFAYTDPDAYIKMKEREAEASESAKARHRASPVAKEDKGMSDSEKRQRANDILSLERRIVSGESPETVEVDIEAFNENSGKPYIYITEEKEGSWPWSDSVVVNKRVDVSTPEKVKEADIPADIKRKLLLQRFPELFDE
jgi:hypothetical protein